MSKERKEYLTVSMDFHAEVARLARKELEKGSLLSDDRRDSLRSCAEAHERMATAAANLLAMKGSKK